MTGIHDDEVGAQVAAELLKQCSGNRQTAIDLADLAAREFFARSPIASNIYRKACEILERQVSP